MENQMLKYNDFCLVFEELNEAHFDIHPVWCEYYQPHELDDLDVPYNWFEENLFERITGVNLDAYYATPSKIDYSKREFVHVLAEIDLGGCSFKGRLFISIGKLQSVDIFIDGEEVSLYVASELADENIVNVKRLIGKEVSSLTYSIPVSSFDLISKKGTYSFPIESTLD
jgi:hypothetical protein